jgi:hypothetical protein
MIEAGGLLYVVSGTGIYSNNRCAYHAPSKLVIFAGGVMDGCSLVPGTGNSSTILCPYPLPGIPCFFFMHHFNQK